MEQLNIEGKRSGVGFVAHKAMLVRALSRALSARVTLLDITIGLRGLLGYLKALGGSNIVKFLTQFRGLALSLLARLCWLLAACHVELQP